MSKFKRRPFMAGHTDVFVMSQPYLTGTEHINSDGLLDSIEALTSGVTQFELSFETEEGSGNFQLDVAVTAEADRTLAAIVEALNTSFGASSVSSLIEASDFEGCLRIQSLGSGLVDTPPLDGTPDTLSYIKILPNDSGSSFVDGADLFGFPSFPHPTAVATAGDLAHSPVRPLIQVNRPGVAFLARGEDRVSQNFNRALHQLSINEDSLNTRLKARVPVPTVLDIERGSTRLQKDASNRIVGLLLTGTHSDALDSILGAESRVFIGGGLSGTSTLLDIADFFSVQDQEDNQIQADQRVVRVGAVTSGYTGSVTVPTFVSESGAPTSSVPDSTVPLDNGNLLGLQYEKTAATVISSVTDGCVLVCDSATFSTDGVIKGDLVTIAGSSITAPISHNGTYYVETVISETELEVRPVDHDNVLILNESESGGLGSATVTTDGNFAQNVVLMFSPPIADFPPDRVAEDGTTPITGVLRIVLGLEAPLGEVPSEFLTRSTVKTAAEVDAFVTRRVWRRMSFDGLYQGQSYDFRGSQQGGGAEGRITHGPISLSVASNRDRPASLTAEMTGTGSLEMRGDDLVLTADPTFVFSDTDIGKVVFVSDTGGTLFADETPFTLSEFLSYREIRLTPPVDYKDWRTADLVGITSCSFEVVSEGQAAIQAAMMFVANDKTAAGDTSSKTGLVFVRNHRDGADNLVSSGTSVLHLERIRHLRGGLGGGVAVDGRFLTVSTAGTKVALSKAGFDIWSSRNLNLFWSRDGTSPVRDGNGVGCTLLRIINGPNAGFYEITAANSGNSLTCTPMSNAFDGDSAWAGFTSTSVTQVANLYNVVFSAGGKRTTEDPISGVQTVVSGITAFADASNQAVRGASLSVARAIQAHWIGEGAGLVIRVNDADFLSTDNLGAGAASGNSIDVVAYSPAKGISVVAEAPDVSAVTGYTYGLKVDTTGHGNNPTHVSVPVDGVDFYASESFAASISQHGRDPGLVIGKREGGLSGAGVGHGAFYQARLSPGPALVVARAMEDMITAPSGLGSAAEFVGSLYVKAKPKGTFSEGGVYAEDVVGAGRWLYPMQGHTPGTREPYSYTTTPPASFTGDLGWQGSPTLGSPGVVVPARSTDPAPAGVLALPTPALFPIEHDCVAVIPSPEVRGFAQPYNTLIGKELNVVSSTVSPGLVGRNFSVVSLVVVSPGTLYLALKSSVVLGAGLAPASMTFSIRGARWHKSHIDIADWFQIGTWDYTKPLSDLPLVTVDTDLFSDRHQIEFSNPFPEDVPDFSGLSGVVSWPSVVDGVGLGRPGASDLMVGADLSDMGTHGWHGTFDAPRHQHMWAENAKEPRPPFYADITVPGTATAFAVQLKDLTYTSTGSVVAPIWSGNWGGSLASSLAGSVWPSTPTSLRIRQRGRRYQLSKHIALLVTVRMAGDWSTANPSSMVDVPIMTVRLKDKDDTVYAEDTLASLPGAIAGIRSPQFTLRVDDTRFLAPDALQASKLTASLFVEVAFTNSSTDARALYIQEIRTEQITREMLVDGPQVVEGAVTAHGFRYTESVKGFKTIAPMEAKHFSGMDYGQNITWPEADPYPGCSMGTQELRGGPGLIRTTSQKNRFNRQTATSLLYLFPALEDGVPIADYLDDINVAVMTGYNGGALYTRAHDDYLDAWSAWLSSPSESTAQGVIDAAIAVRRSAYNKRREILDQDGGFSSHLNWLADYMEAIDDAIGYEDAVVDAYNAEQTLAYNAVEDRWIRPNIDLSKHFDVGIQSATVNLYNGAYDPLYYALQASFIGNDDPSDARTPLSKDLFIPPGHTGFQMVLDAPHGSLLSELSVRLSVRQGENHYGIFTDVPDNFATINTSSYFKTKAHVDDWTEKTGVLVEVWRHSMFSPGGSAAAFADFSEELSPSTAEVVFRTTMAPSSAFAVVVNNRADNWIAPGLVGGTPVNVDAGREFHFNETFNLLADANEVAHGWSDWKSMLRVDRRVYSYILVIRFIGGPRTEVARSDLGADSPISMPYTMSGDSWYGLGDRAPGFDMPKEHWIRRQLVVDDYIYATDVDGDGNVSDDYIDAINNFDPNQYAPVPIYGTYEPGPDVTGWQFTGLADQSHGYHPFVKFRGARIGWLTDRGGDGGWGS